MSQLDRLPPDQRAVLSLVLDRGRSYAQVAEMLGIPESTVRDRALDALDALAAEAGRPRTQPEPASARGVRPATPTEDAEPLRARDALGASSVRRGPGGPAPAGKQPTGSRRAGAILLGAIVVVVVVVIVLVSSGGGKGAATGTGTTTSTGTTSSTNTSSAKPKLDKTIALSSPNAELKASGSAYVLSQGSRSAFYITAQGLPESKGFFYAVWLYNSPSSSTPLGRASNVGSDGKMQGGNPLPSNAGQYRQMIVTRETSTHPAHPGPIVLQGTFALH
jgi:hypothetical protein